MAETSQQPVGSSSAIPTSPSATAPDQPDTSPTSSTASWEENFVKRHGASIDFAAQSARDHDRPRSFENPTVPAPRVRGRSLLAEIAAESETAHSRHNPASDQHNSKYDPLTGQPIMRRQSRRERIATRHPMLQTAVDEQVSDNYILHMPESSTSSTSTSTLSPPFGLALSATESGDDFLRSADGASSPILIPRGASFPRALPRSKTHQVERTTGSLRRASRRSSTRTGSSSFSPAGAFLSQYRDEPGAQAEPDDEGQEIGDNGEYIIGRQIGFGGFSVVKEVFTIEDDEKVRRAVKIVRKHITGQSEQDNENVQTEFEHEVFIWRYLKHRYVLPLLAVYENSFATYCIAPFNAGGTLFDLIRRQRKTASFVMPSNSQSSRDAPRGVSPMVRKALPLSHLKRYMYQIASALRYLHQDMRVVHRDLKLENCLLDNTASLTRSISSLSSSFSSITSLITDPTDPGNILLCDFGMADFVAREDRDSFRPSSSHDSTSTRTSTDLDADLNDLSSTITTLDGTRPGPAAYNIGPGPVSANLGTSNNIAGSLQYASPELIRASKPIYDTSIDMWAFGVVSFALLTGELPFSHGLAPKVQARILQGDWDVDLLRESVGRSLRAGRDGDENPAHGDDDEVECAVQLIRGCLAMDVYTRWDVARVLECGFLQAEPGLYERVDDV